jgi:hypothetical protein
MLKPSSKRSPCCEKVVEAFMDLEAEFSPASFDARIAVWKALEKEAKRDAKRAARDAGA